jgi:hypothetical protein
MKNIFQWKFTLAFLTLFWIGMSHLTAAEITLTTWRSHEVLLLKGRIDEGTFEKLEKTYASIAPLPHGLPVMLLDSPGGSVDEALKISHFLDINQTHTVIPDGAICASACASIIFIAGSARTIEEGGLLGQHSCSRGGIPDRQCNEVLSKHAVEHGVSHGSVSAFVSFVPPDAILWLDRKDAEGWGLTKYPGEELSGFEKSEPSVIKTLLGRMPPAQAAWRISFREDGYEAFSRGVSDMDRELQLNLFCSQKARGRVFLSLEVYGDAETVERSLDSATVKTDQGSWVADQRFVRQRTSDIVEVVTLVPKERLKDILTKVDELSFILSFKQPYVPMGTTTYLKKSRKVLLFAANNCTDRS